jgi:Uma2 family endonuclease
MSIAIPEPPVRNGYPTSDGRPMAETDRHRLLMIDLQQALQDWFADDPNIYISGNLLLFYEKGNKRRHVSPDIFVVFGIANHERPNYLLWEEGRGPNVVIELTSSSTRKEDTNKKFKLYQDVLRVPEYFLFDPFGDYLQPRLQGYRLVQGKYRPMPVKGGQLLSRQLNLILEPVEKVLRLVDPDSRQRIPTRAEARRAAEQAKRAAEERTRAETEARVRAEAEVERLRAKLAAHKPHN